MLLPVRGPRAVESANQHRNVATNMTNHLRLHCANIRQFSERQSTASHITAHIKPSRLQLYFVCDVEDLEAGMRADEPFLSLPTLADCSIRLSHKSNRALQDLARNTATRAVGNCSGEPTSPFRFLDLPQGLRCQILEYTDLVTPLCEVEWKPEERFCLHNRTWRCSNGYEYCPPAMLASFETAGGYRMLVVTAAATTLPSHSHQNAITSLHQPPYSSYVGPCKKMFKPYSSRKIALLSLLLRGALVLLKARQVVLEISVFLTSTIPPNALGLLRFLEVVFPSFDEDYLHPHEPAYQDWLRTIDCVSDKLCLPTLALRVYMSDHDLCGYDATPFRNDMTKEQANDSFNVGVEF